MSLLRCRICSVIPHGALVCWQCATIKANDFPMLACQHFFLSSFVSHPQQEVVEKEQRFPIEPVLVPERSPALALIDILSYDLRHPLPSITDNKEHAFHAAA